MQKTTSKIFLEHDLDKAEQEAIAAGCKVAPPDHPIYYEGASITFLHRTQEKET